MSNQSMMAVQSAAPPRFLRLLARLLLHDRGQSFRWGFAAGAFAVALTVRLLLDDWLPPGFPFLTFFPAVLLTAVLAGLRAGMAVAAAGFLASWFYFVVPAHSFGFGIETLTAMAFYVLITGTELVFIAATEIALRRLRDAQARAERLAESRELLLAEMQHRVSNNLATVAALLRAQSAQVQDAGAKAALGAAQQRIMTVSRLQRRLHRPEVQDVALEAYLPEITADTLDAAGIDPGLVETGFAAVRVSQEVALPLGLVLCELLLNAVEHAGGGPEFRVRISLTLKGGEARLTVADTGPGLPPGFDLAQADSLGLSVAQQFAGQIGGTLELHTDPEGGVRASLQFPLLP